MSILVTAATEMELAPFAEKNNNIRTLITGVGAPIALYHLAKEISKNSYSLIIQVGIAGAFNRDQSLGEAVVIEKDCFADLGVNEKGGFKSIFEMGLTDANAFPFEEGFLVNKAINKFQTENLKVVNAVTVNLISDKDDFIHQLQSKYNSDIETMEGAAFHYVCLQEKVPFLQVRGISNHVGERDKSKWKIKEAVDSSNCFVSKIIQSFQSNHL